MKFDTCHFFGPSKKPVDFGRNQSTPWPSSHTNVLPEYNFICHKSLEHTRNALIFGADQYSGDFNPSAKFRSNRSTIDPRSHISEIFANHQNFKNSLLTHLLTTFLKFQVVYGIIWSGLINYSFFLFI